ncbi:MAG: hypothetical protein Q7V20_16430 [Aquabacterium sp.]|uniref:hypothetical protein n=1 Tax=Aquabacterium sp. TaxID=1872578 RepID=UPI0027212E03|nr:hypothetical protein [Aquabacterium sp.]MDO9005032.1 hypothetical protein [Aquabacterium sp.]
MTATDDSLGKSADSQEKLETPLTREALYALVWSEPMLKVAAKFGVSSSYMARVCTRMNVPRPERGYWAKLAVGNTQKQVPLPEAHPGNELIWSRDGSSEHVPRPLPKPPVHTRRMRTTPTLRMSQHPLINGTKALFESGRLSYGGEYLKPAKKLLVDMAVTKTGLDKALSFANQFFLSLEEHGYRVVIAPHGEHLRREEVDERENPGKHRHFNNLWSPGRDTVVYVGTVAIGLTIIEMSEEVEVRYVNGEYVRVRDYVPPKRGRYAVDHSWTTMKDIPTGRLCLQAYSPYARAKWKKQWRETTAARSLDAQIRGIVKELEEAAVEVAHLVEEGMRQAEIEHQQWEAQRREWRREEEERRTAKALKQSREDLHHIIDRWAESNRIEQFFVEAERRAAALDAEERLRLLDRLKQARELIGSIDALDHFLDWKSPDER